MSNTKEVKQITLAGFVITITGAILFSTKAIFVKLAFAATHTDAVTLLALRMLFSLPFYLVAARIAYTKENKSTITTKHWVYILILGFLGYYLSSLFDFIGLQFISAGLERLILFLYPTFAVLINTLFFKNRLSSVQITALILTYIGIGLAYYGELKIDTYNPNFFYGSFMVFLCAVTYSFYLVGTGKMVNIVGATRYTAYAMLAATGGIFIHFLLTRSIGNIHFTPTLIAYSCALAIVATVLPSFLISNGMKKIGSNNVAIITSIGPVSTILQAYFILGENIFFEQILGTILVLIGVLLIGYKAADSNN
ncbi:MAG: DMT family transporter [Chitinophagaceae bacterium]|nr:DMT family transporter [Chitinophagaceae bacterium]MBP9740045.1 DMT family transporter [Chitinophagaceae bacterium]